VTISEESEPSSQLQTQPGTYRGHTPPATPLGLLPHRVLEFRQALLPRQTQSATEVVA
jgi:hypothetical protein